MARYGSFSPRIHPLPVPFEDPVNDDGMTQIMDAWPDLACSWFQTGHAQNGDKVGADGVPAVVPAILIVPEQASLKTVRDVGLLPRLEKPAQGIHSAL